MPVPTGAFVTPEADVEVSGVVPIEVTAAHSSGIANVIFYVNPDYADLGNTFGIASWIWTDISSPYTANWDTTGLPEGEYTLVVMITPHTGPEKLLYRTVRIGAPVVTVPPQIEWDKPGDRRYETGIDRGVLYAPDGAVPWNGLVSVLENTERDVKSYYVDGVKFLDTAVVGAYSAKLQAFTYPDELEELMGSLQFAPGVFAHDQRSKSFGLSYRTLVGNDIDGTDHGYKLHLVYNVTAVPSGLAMNTLNASSDLSPFEWSLTGVPATMFGIRPTAHLSFHSAAMDPALLASIEEIIYGTEEIAATLPSVVELLTLVEAAYA